jgi:hypothetical protein
VLALVEQWRESAAWELEHGSPEFGKGRDQCADELEAALKAAPHVEQERQEDGPLPFTPEMAKAAYEWAADDRLWTTQDTVEFNLRTFARVILKLYRPQPVAGSQLDRSQPVKCADYAPAGYAGHWREWHRGHGCNLDPSASPSVVSEPK